MPVFISHKNCDTPIALRIGEYLKGQGIVTYIDVLDPSTKNADDITATVLHRLSLCTHLIAVVSTNTKESWWVPFEIGAATEGARRISSYKYNCSDSLPEYLEKWPVMTLPDHLNHFVKHYKTDFNRKAVLESASDVLQKSYRGEATNFHDALKRSIRFGY